MTKAQAQKIDTLMAALAEDEREIYREIAEYAIALGYAPSQMKNTHGLTEAVAFTKKKINRRLCKISPPSANTGKGKALYQARKTILALSFYATPDYSAFFRDAIEQELATVAVERRGCANCKQCNGGYTYVSDDEVNIGCCQWKMIELPPVDAQHMNEIKTMMKTQDKFWTGT
jgi:hypothetical protein